MIHGLKKTLSDVTDNKTRSSLRQRICHNYRYTYHVHRTARLTICETLRNDDPFRFLTLNGTTFSIWATELDSCSPYSNSNSSTISNQPRFNELEMQSILFELDSTISCSIKKTSSTNSICSYRPQLFLSSSVCHVFYQARFASHSIGFILSSIWYRARLNLHSAKQRMIYTAKEMKEMTLR